MNTKHIEWKENATRQFIQDAIDGGWRSHRYRKDATDGDFVMADVHFEIILDPKAWKAVGKVRGYNENFVKVRMMTFVSRLADGKSIEEALAEISK